MLFNANAVQLFFFNGRGLPVSTFWQAQQAWQVGRAYYCIIQLTLLYYCRP